jgi:hypothetical protein
MFFQQGALLSATNKACTHDTNSGVNLFHRMGALFRANESESVGKSGVKTELFAKMKKG